MTQVPWGICCSGASAVSQAEYTRALQMVADVWQPFPNGIQIQRPLLPSDALELYIVKKGMLC